MEPEAAYPAARIVSPKVHAYLARQRADFGGGNGYLAPLPDIPAIEAIVDAAFWASLRREEGFLPKISLAFLSPEESTSAFLFERPLPLEPGSLTKVSPAVERPGIHLGVWRGPAVWRSPAVWRGPAVWGGHPAGPADLMVWGAPRVLPSLCLVVEVAAPGLIVIKHYSSEATGKFVNIAVLEGDQVKIIDERFAAIPDCPALLTALLGTESRDRWVSPLAQPVNVLVQLAVSMRAHGRGGSLLLVPAVGEAWRESIVLPIPYAVSPPFSGLADFAQAAGVHAVGAHAGSTQAGSSQAESAHAESARAESARAESVRASINNDIRRLNRTVDAVAGLTAVDGALVLTEHYQVLGFGAKITRRKGFPLVEQVLVTEPIEGGQATLVHPEKLGGTRHLSAAQFVHDQHDHQQECAALVASQDGRFTVFEWSACEGMVHAHRVEALLL